MRGTRGLADPGFVPTEAKRRTHKSRHPILSGFVFHYIFHIVRQDTTYIGMIKKKVPNTPRQRITTFVRPAFAGLSTIGVILRRGVDRHFLYSIFDIIML